MQLTTPTRADRLRLEALVVVALGAAVLDVLVTYYAVTHRWGSELNPLAIHTISAIGLRGTMAVNLALRLFIVASLWGIAAAAPQLRARTAATICLTTIGAFWTLVAIANVLVVAFSFHR